MWFPRFQRSGLHLVHRSGLDLLKLCGWNVRTVLIQILMGLCTSAIICFWERPLVWVTLLSVILALRTKMTLNPVSTQHLCNVLLPNLHMYRQFHAVFQTEIYACITVN